MAQKYTARDLVGVLGIVPTPATPNAGRWDSNDTVDVGVTTAMIRDVAPVVDAIMTLGTFGEGATLTEAEVVTFMSTVVAERGTTPVFAGATSLNTRDTIRRARTLVDIGVDGLFLGRPMWCEMDDDAIVGFYSDIADALPDIPVILYDNPSAFKGKISSELYARLAAIPTLIGAKYTFLGAQYADDAAACGDDIRLLPMDADWLDAHRLAGQHAAACWTPSAACGTEPLERLREAMAASDWLAAETITRDVKKTYSTLMPDGDFSSFSRYNIPLDKARIAAAGVFDPGPARLGSAVEVGLGSRLVGRAVGGPSCGEATRPAPKPGPPASALRPALASAQVTQVLADSCRATMPALQERKLQCPQISRF